MCLIHLLVLRPTMWLEYNKGSLRCVLVGTIALLTGDACWFISECHGTPGPQGLCDMPDAGASLESLRTCTPLLNPQVQSYYEGLGSMSEVMKLAREEEDLPKSPPTHFSCHLCCLLMLSNSKEAPRAASG